ncbi:MAG: 3-phosphoshikimate 1-carboxyvinyltransferase [Acidimicrobiia bacterium]|nr:3-phosphoshikimate 1-carboxyvinyltransferase [Acidimicrobiia bacterium]
MRAFRLPPGPCRAAPHIPGDKSLSHRALLLAAMAAGTSRVANLGPGQDVAATAEALGYLGVEVARGEVRSRGIDAWTAPPGPLDAGNSATTMRLLAGALCGRAFTSTVVGDGSLMGRPMDRLAGPLEALGARIELGPGGRPPLTMRPASLHGAAVAVTEASAQVRSAVAFAGLQAEGATTITSPAGFRDHTERWLEAMGLGRRLGPSSFELLPGPVPPAHYELPADLSSAAGLLAAAALRPGSEMTVRDVTLNPGRTGFLDILEAMGARVTRAATRLLHGDPVGDVVVSGADLRGIRIQGLLAARAIDELPLVGILAAAAEGETVVAGAAELRVKETDRATATVRLIRALGGDAEERPDGFVVQGTGGLAGGSVDAGGDHRIAIAAAVAAVVAPEVLVEGFEAVAVSWPGFGEALEALWS